MSIRYVRILAGFMLAAAAAAVAADGADPELAAIDDVLAARASAARHLLLASGSLLYARSRTRDRGGDWVIEPLALRTAGCGYTLRQGSELRTTTWQMSVEPNMWVTNGITFESVNAERREVTSISTRSPGSPNAHMSAGPPSQGIPGFLMHLGLSRTGGETLLSVLPEPVALSEATLRGQRCKVLASGRYRLWLAPDLGYAPMRFEQGLPPAARLVTDWFGYSQYDGVALPRFLLLRDVGTNGIEMMSISKHQTIVVGAKAVAAEEPVGWDVPVVGGADAQGLGGERVKVGISPDDLRQVVQLDGQPWGLSLAKLAADAACDQPLPAVAADGE